MHFDDSDLFYIKRFYATLKRDKTYKKRITWFENMPGYPEKCKTIAVAEYLGCLPKNDISVHGNAKKTNQEYTRASSKLKEKVLFELKSDKSVRDIFEDQFRSDNPPRDSKFIENIKTKLSKETNPGNRQNNADDIQAVLNLAANADSFVREVVQMAGAPPNLICYTENQLKLLTKASTKSVVGVDRTFNLGACYVTTTVFQDYDLKRKGKDVSPILLGPMYLHWDGSFQTYQRFFTHLAAVLEKPLTDSKLGTNHLVIGSDEEKALVKAIKASFPESQLTLCTRHLEENMKRQLKNKIGMPEKESKAVLSDIFGTNGLTNLDTSVDFSTKAAELSRKYGQKIGTYLTDKMIPTIKEHVHEVIKTDQKLPLNWKNNHCEAMNHIFKLNLNWKPSKLPDLTNMLEKEVRHQEALIRGALYGHGDYELANEAQVLRTLIASWQNKTEKEKDLLFSKFIKFSIKNKKDNILKSTDGKLVIPKTSTVARKPGQKRRIKDSKTFSMNKRARTE